MTEQTDALDPERFASWLAASGVDGHRRVVRASERKVLVSKFEPEFFERLEEALLQVPELFEVERCRGAYREALQAGAPSRPEAWRLGMERILRDAESAGLIDAGQRAEVMGGVDSVAALLEGALWTDPGGDTSWMPSAGEVDAVADVRNRLEPDGDLFTRYYGEFEGRTVMNHCPGSRYARRLFELACAVCFEPQRDA